MRNVITERKLIREMDCTELEEYVSSLSDLDDTTGTTLRLVRDANEEYKQQSGRDMRERIEQLPLICGAMLLAAYDPALCDEKIPGTL